MDTGIFVALFAGDEEATPWAQRVLEETAVRSVLAVSPAVYAEFIAGGRSLEAVEAFFSEKGIEVDWEIGGEVWRTRAPATAPMPVTASVGTTPDREEYSLTSSSAPTPCTWVVEPC